MMSVRIVVLIIVTALFGSCRSEIPASDATAVKPGAERINEYLGMLSGKRVAIVANQTSVVNGKHLIDTLLSAGVNIRHIFAPEHGFRDLAPAGDKIADGRDPLTGIKIISLYGSHLKPTKDDLDSIDVVVFDIQDVGTRFYTYISTMSLVMESCAENGVKMLILDRPNPNGYLCDGNILDPSFSSFVGMHPVPIAHGMTAGEYGLMVNGESWLKDGIHCDLTVIKCENWDHETLYDLPVKPSPNLPNQTSVYLYPTLCFFEGTVLSCGRGTEFPFQVYGHPRLPDKGFSFTPAPNTASLQPPLNGERCFGRDFRAAISDGTLPARNIMIEWIIEAYNDFPEKEKFFKKYFDTLAGGTELREQIVKGMSASQIRASWRTGLDSFNEIRQKYLLYK
jgi:uncharacterized protein YbbC (DUF1343 family)